MTTKRAGKRAREPRTAKQKPGVVADMSAADGMYLGNSAKRDVDEARMAYERADRWAKSPAGTKY